MTQRGKTTNTGARLALDDENGFYVGQPTVRTSTLALDNENGYYVGRATLQGTTLALDDEGIDDVGHSTMDGDTTRLALTHARRMHPTQQAPAPELTLEPTGPPNKRACSHLTMGELLDRHEAGRSRTTSKKQSWSLPLTQSRDIPSRQQQRHIAQRRLIPTAAVYMDWKTAPPPAAKLVRDRRGFLRGCQVTNNLAFQKASRNSAVEVQWTRCGTNEVIASERLIEYHTFMFPTIDTDTKEPWSPQQTMRNTTPPPAVLEYSNATFIRPGTFTCWTLPPDLADTGPPMAFLVTPYHGTTSPRRRM